MKNYSNIPHLDFQTFKSKFIAKDVLPFDMNEGFKIFRVQDIIRHLKFPLPLHRTDYYDILFVSKGSNSVKHCGLRQYEIKAGNIFFKPAGQITSGDVLGKDVKGFFCLLSGDFIATHLGNANSVHTFPFFRLTENPIVELAKENLKKFQFLFEIIHQQYYAKDKRGTQNAIIASYLNVILHEAAAIHHAQNINHITGPQTTAAKLAENFKSFVAEYCLTKRKVSDYAALLFVTSSHLNKTIKAITGKTASSIISEMILLEAKVLLKQSNMNVSEIAFYLGFEDTSYFNRFFKKHVSITPIEYRKLH